MDTRWSLAVVSLAFVPRMLPAAEAADVPDVCYVALAEFQPAGSANADGAAAVSRAVAEAVSETPSFAIVRDPGCAESLADSYMNPAHSIEADLKYRWERALSADLIVIGRICDLGDARSVVAKVVSTGTHSHFMVRHLCAVDEDPAAAGEAVAEKMAAGVKERLDEMLRDVLPPEERFASLPETLRDPTAPRVALATMPWEKSDAAGRMDLAQASWATAGGFLQKMGFTTVGPEDPPDWYVNAVIALDYTARPGTAREACMTVHVRAWDAAKELLYDRCLFRRIRGEETEAAESATAARLTGHMVLDLAPLLFNPRARVPVADANDP